MKSYIEIKNEQPSFNEVFFAFSMEQYEENKVKAGIGDKPIIKGGMGMYGTKEGLEEVAKFYDNLCQRVADNCNPQDVYNYEFDNHECGYVCDDEEAILIVVDYFGKERTKEVKRKYAYLDIDNIR